MNAEIEFLDIFVTDKRTLITSADIITSAAADATRAHEYMESAAADAQTAEEAAEQASQFAISVSVANEDIAITTGGGA